MNWFEGEPAWFEPGVEPTPEERRALRRSTHTEWQVGATFLCALGLLVFGLSEGAHPTTATQRALIGALLATFPIRGAIWLLCWIGARLEPERSETA